ncbi:MAG TPA: alpha/beta hydrolase [Bacilli bacterium]|nr:alpha/beta hydrolase [Bacilli bacterium]
MKNSLKLIFIHGAGGTDNKWRKVKADFKDLDCNFINLPGHGTNEEPICETIEQYAEQLSKTITEDCIVVGHSMGGMIAIELAARNRHVKGIVLAASFYELPVHPKIIQSLAEGIFPESVFRASYAKEVDENLLKEEKQELDQAPTEIAMKGFIACDQYKNGEVTFSQLMIPIMAIAGDEDRLIPNGALETLQEKNERTEGVTIAGAGHYIHLEKSDAFANELHRFYQQVSEILA